MYSEIKLNVGFLKMKFKRKKLMKNCTVQENVGLLKPCYLVFTHFNNLSNDTIQNPDYE